MLIKRSLIFYEVFRLIDFTDVMIVGAYPGQQGICIYLITGGFGQVGYAYRMAVGAWRKR